MSTKKKLPLVPSALPEGMNDTLYAYAIRYAIGRSTYAVHDVMAEVLRAWIDLSEATKISIIRDVQEHIHARKAWKSNNKEGSSGDGDSGLDFLEDNEWEVFLNKLSNISDLI